MRRADSLHGNRAGSREECRLVSCDLGADADNDGIHYAADYKRKQSGCSRDAAETGSRYCGGICSSTGFSFLGKDA